MSFYVQFMEQAYALTANIAKILSKFSFFLFFLFFFKYYNKG